MERILGSLPIIAVVGHEESRGCTELCWPDILNLVKKRAAGERFVNSYLVPWLHPHARFSHVCF
jgi:hypothetical protein